MRRPKVHISQRSKVIRRDSQHVEVNRVIGRIGNSTVTIDVDHGIGYQRRMLLAKQVIHRRLGIPYAVDSRDIWQAMVMPGGWS